uniref:non-specific serine/threonine protein kinase n=1 Tax=Oryza barthii TaxID=65489 RepID=A0A0D3GHQ3_9ORYZ
MASKAFVLVLLAAATLAMAASTAAAQNTPQDFLDAHNDARRGEGAGLGDVGWNTTLQAFAENHVAGLAAAGCSLAHSTLFDDSGSPVWQSFDHPADVLLPGQYLRPGMRLTVNALAADFSEGSLYVSVGNNAMSGFVGHDPPQLYFTAPVSDTMDTLANTMDAPYIRVVSDGHMRLYGWNSSSWVIMYEVLQKYTPAATASTRWLVAAMASALVPGIAVAHQRFIPLQSTEIGQVSDVSWRHRFLAGMYEMDLDEKDGRPLDWSTRHKIVSDIARGLCYLHKGCKQRIVHLDIKPQNILLDDQFNAKISDFGVAKLVDKDRSRVMTRMRGTPGYMAPEWLTSTITEKADVYSFGVVVLEIICGRRNLDHSQPEEALHLMSLLQDSARNDKLLDMIDHRMDDMQLHSEDVMHMMHLAMWCL